MLIKLGSQNGTARYFWLLAFVLFFMHTNAHTEEVIQKHGYRNWLTVEISDIDSNSKTEKKHSPAFIGINALEEYPDTRFPNFHQFGISAWSKGTDSYLTVSLSQGIRINTPLSPYAAWGVILGNCSNSEESCGLTYGVYPEVGVVVDLTWPRIHLFAKRLFLTSENSHFTMYGIEVSTLLNFPKWHNP